MKKSILFLFIGVSTFGFAQKNLVPNYNFQEIIEKVKEKGAIASAGSWTSPTLAQADLYVKKTKNPAIGVPVNSYGEEKPMDGDNYAGIIAYSYKGKVPRSYLQVKLKEPLTAGEEYCFTMNVSLSDLSKYACNHVGMAVSDKELSANNSEVLKFDNPIVSRKLTIYEKQFYWTPICGVYKAKGGEQYLTIGNFTEDLKTQIKKVKRPRGFTTPQTYDAYYFIDNVSVVSAAESKKCDCDSDPGMANAETVSRNFNSEGEPKVGSVKFINSDGTSGNDITKDSLGTKTSNVVKGIDGLNIEFDAMKNTISSTSTSLMERVVGYMKEHETTTITITGYIDKTEAEVDKLAGKRVATVYKYLSSKGIKKERLDRSIGGADSPVDKKNAAKNMRVEITILEE